uniref:Exocyst complex component Sec8 n=1 Tax=Hucho hucho TaxID=62062 RepID=A0A4W5K1U6_9TELE
MTSSTGRIWLDCLSSSVSLLLNCLSSPRLSLLSPPLVCLSSLLSSVSPHLSLLSPHLYLLTPPLICLSSPPLSILSPLICLSSSLSSLLPSSINPLSSSVSPLFSPHLSILSAVLSLLSSPPRVHCFHYLIPLAKQGNYAIVANVESMDYDPLVVKLNKDISAIEEVMGAALQQHKFQYIFEGLGHLISCILINGAQYFKRISESGIKKMCRNIFVLQQNLTNITMSREADLDFARQYYEMLYNAADELLNLVVDQGVRYTELEYIHALSLLQRSQTGVGDLSTQNVRLQRLKEIICEQAAFKQATKDKKITTV